MIHAPRPRSSIPRASAAGAIVLAGLALGACRPRIDPAPREPRAAVTADASVPDSGDDRIPDLGPADPILAPLSSPTPEPYELSLPARPRIGRTSTGARRPASGAEPLLVAVNRPLRVVARDESFVHVAAWRADGRPAAGARVFLGEREIGRTDRHGALVVAMPIAPDQGAGTLWVIDGPRCGAMGLAPVQHRAGVATDHLFVHADRGVFRPGDTLHLRGIGTRLARDERPLDGAEVEVQLRDEEGHTVVAATARTDDLGVLAADLPIATTARAGLHTLSVAHGSERVETRVQVRDFSPAQVRIDHTLPFYLPRDARRLAFDLRLSEPAGEPLRTADVEVVLSVEGDARLSLHKRVEGGGPHAFEIGRRDLERVRAGTEPGDVVVATVRATDAEGRRDEVRRQLRVTDHPFVARLQLDRERYTTADPVVIALRLADLDRVPERRKPVELRLRSPKTAITLQAETDGGGQARFRFDMPASAVDAALFVDGVDSAIAAITVPWGPRAAMEAELGDAPVSQRAPTNVTIRFPGDWAPAEDVVHADIVDASGAIVDAVLLAVKNERGRWVARGRVTAPSWGTGQLSTFVLGRRVKPGTTRADPSASELSLLTAGASLDAAADRELAIVLDGLPAKIRPGSPIDVRAKIRDRRGRPVRAAVGAALVDGAVMALKDPLEPAAIEARRDPRRRTLATLGVEVPPWPVLSRNWGERRVDVALPPFAAVEGGAIEQCGDRVDPPAEIVRTDAAARGATVATTARPRPARDPAASRPIQTEITLRTRVPTTTMWIPSLRGNGEVQIEGRLSGTLGDQELVVVASDDAGGLGLARAKIRAMQPVSVRADLPGSMVLGERIEIPVVVHNATDAKRRFEVELRAGATTETDAVDVAARRQEVVALALEPSDRGELDVHVRARGTEHDDALDRTIAVRTPGLPLAHANTAQVAGGTTSIDVDIPPGAASHELELRLVAPVVTTALLGLDALSTAVVDDPAALAVDVATSASRLAWGRGHAMREDRQARLRGRALAAVGLLRLLQRSDGSFGMHRGGDPSAYATTAVLEGLLDADAAGIPVEATVARASQWLAARVAHGRLLPPGDAAELEGDRELAREGLTARIYAALARVPAAHRSDGVETALRAQDARWSSAVATVGLDPLTRAYALSGLALRGRLDAEDTHAVLRRWEGARWTAAWFHVHDGPLQATATIATVLHGIAPETFAAQTREALRTIVASHDGKGSRDAPGTAAAMRAMLQLGEAPPDEPQRVDVHLDGRLVQRVAIDPADPLPGFEALSRVPLGRDLTGGRHTVRIDATEGLRGSARVVTRVWTPAAGSSAKRRGLRLAAHGPDVVVSGTHDLLRIEAAGVALSGGTIRVAKSGLFEVDRAELARRVGPGRAIISFTIDDEALHLRVAPGRREVAIAVPLHAARRGSGRLPSVAIDPVGGGGSLVVDPGPVRVD